MKVKNTILAIFIGILSIFPNPESLKAQMLPDLVITRFAINRLEWRQMPDCDHNACQNLVWKALIEFTLTVQNQGQATAQIPNGNFESSAITDTLFHKEDNLLVSKIFNWESVPNALAAGQIVQLTGKMYIEDNPRFLKIRDEYIMCLTITDKASDNQNWVLLESNSKNNTLCSNFILDLPTHTPANFTVTNINLPAQVQRNADQSADFQVIYTVKNTTKQVYTTNFGRHIEMNSNGVVTTFCRGNVAPGLHGLEQQNITCNIHLDAGTAAGVYTLQAIVDPGNRMIESNEHDNILKKQIQIL